MAQIVLNEPSPCSSSLDWMRMSQEGSGPSSEQCKEMIFELVGAEPTDQFIFTSSGAEAIASVHWTAFMELARKEGKCHFITTPVEDASLLQSLKRLEELGCFVKFAPLNSIGQIDLAKLAELIGPRTAMISISLAHGLSGVIQPIEEIAQLAREKGAFLHVDASYALGKMANPFAFADYLTFSGDQIHSVKGSGALFAKKGRPVHSIIPGNLEVDIPSLIALGSAASQATLSLDTMSLEVARLRDKLEAAGAPLLKDALRLPNVALLSFPRVHQGMLHYILQRKNLLSSIGGTRSPHLNRYLISCGVDEIAAQSAISFTLTRYTTEEEIDRAILIIKETALSILPIAEDLF